MAESINDIAIKLSVDAAGVSRGFRTAAEEARSYKAELDRLVYAVGKNDPVDYNAHVQQFMQATNERLAREKKAQEEFNAWYRVEAEKEFQAWYAIELKKEQVRNQQLAEERQRAINTANAQRYQAVPEAETLNRAMSNDKLEEAIRARYALLDQDERAIRDNAANRTAAMLRANVDAQRLHEQDLQNLREYITQKYAILNREEAIEKMNASNAAEIARLRNMRARQAADAANAQRDADFAAYKADLARQEAEGMINAERTARIERARQRDAKRAADDDRVRQLNDWRMQQALMQRAAVDTQLAVARMNGGFGGAAMAIGQASYAAEDFIQVLSMGGGLNMALMSASNNLSMVARSLMGTSMAMSAVAGLAVPAVLIGTNLLIQNMMKEEEQVGKNVDTYKKLHEELQRVQAATDRHTQHKLDMQAIDDLTTYAAASARLKQEIIDLAKAESDITKTEEKLSLQRKDLRDTLSLGSVVKEAQSILDAMALSPEIFDWMDVATAEDDVRRLTAAYKDLADTLSHGTPEAIKVAAEEFQSAIKNTKEIGRVYTDFADKFDNQLKPILGNEEETLKLEQIGKLMADLNDLQNNAKEIADEATKVQETTNRLLRQENQLRQDQIRFKLQANEADQKNIDIQNQLSAFLGIDAPNPMQGMNFNDMNAAQAGQAREFLQMLLESFSRERDKILEEQRQVSPTGGMEQSAFKAQAEALQQMLEAQYKKEDPQLKDIDLHIQQGNQLLQQLTDGQGLIRVP